MSTITVGLTLTKMDCGRCGAVYAINEWFRKCKEQYGGGWNCPYCGSAVGYSETEVQRLERALEAKRRREANLEADLKSAIDKLNGQLAVTARMKNRIAKGVCPCCKRSFVDLRKHMACKHKDFVKA